MALNHGNLSFCRICVSLCTRKQDQSQTKSCLGGERTQRKESTKHKHKMNLNILRRTEFLLFLVYRVELSRMKLNEGSWMNNKSKKNGIISNALDWLSLSSSLNLQHIVLYRLSYMFYSCNCRALQSARRRHTRRRHKNEKKILAHFKERVFL